MILAALALAGCRGLRPGDPPAVAFGRDVCARCGMIVSEERFAAGFVDEGGESRIFDDAGEFLAALAGDRSRAPAAFVRDYEGTGWVKAPEAWYVRDPKGGTPMGTGVVAFREKARAQTFAGEKGASTPVSLDGVLNNDRSGG